MTVRYTIVIDDDDSEICPDSPYTANVYKGGTESEPVAIGVGATPVRAVQDATGWWLR